MIDSRPAVATIKISVLVCAFMFLASLMMGCAYHMGSGDRDMPGGYREIAVPVFKNLTNEVGAEVYFTNAFVRELERSRIGHIAAKSSSQVTLYGTITSIRATRASTTTSSGLQSLPAGSVLNTEYRVSVDSDLRLVRNSDQKEIWSGKFTKERSYQTPRIGKVARYTGPDASVTGGSETLTSANAPYNFSARSQTIQEIATEMMVEAHSRLTERF